MTRPEPTEEDRANWALNAYQMGHRHPDTPEPVYKKFSRSWDAWREGREDRLTGKPMFDPPRYQTALSESFKSGFKP